MNKRIILAIFVIVVAIVAILLTMYFISSKTENPTKLFDATIGTVSSTDASSVGIFVDERTISKYDKFYFPASFTVDKDSDMVAVLDSIRNRIAIFSMSGEYRGDIKLPFVGEPIDLAWTAKNSTFKITYQTKQKIGNLKINPNNLTVISSSTSDTVEKEIIPNIASSTSGIARNIDGKNLTSLQFIGTDKIKRNYISALYNATTDIGTSSLLVYRLNPAGVSTGHVQVFPSPRMLVNRYFFVDQNGEIFYMKLDDEKTIGFYKFEIQDR